MGSLIFDGHDIGLLCAYGDPVISILNSSVDYADAKNRNGSIVLGKTWGNSSVSFSVGLSGQAQDRRNRLSTLGVWLNVDEPKKLVLPDTPDRYYLAIPEGELQLERGVHSDIGQLTFTLVDPIAYGAEKSVWVPYSGSVTFVVGGTAPTLPYFNRTLERPDQTTKQWGLRLDGDDVFVMDFGTTSNCYIKADFSKGVAFLNDNIKMPTLNSDWFKLTPGEHTIENHIGGGNDLRLRWVERWL